MKKIINVIKTFRRNIKLLFRVSLNDQLNKKEQIDFDELKYELSDEIKNLQKPNIKNIEETIDDLIKTKASICRFGDGELQLIEGKDIPFQKSSLELSKRLLEVLSSKENNIFIAIPKIIYSSKNNIVEISKSFWRQNGASFRNRIEKHIDFNHQYYAAELTLAFSMFEIYDVENYFQKMSKIWEDKDITIICGKSVFDQINYNIFHCANSIEYQYAEGINAFDNYENILTNALKIQKNRIVISILGPAAKVLSYDLAKQGYQALDLGHIAKSYDWRKKEKSTKTMSEAIDFFNAD